MTYFLFFSVILVGIIFQKSKLASVYILTGLYLLAAFNYSNADYYAYTVSYRLAGMVGAEYRYIGYSLLIRLFGRLGFSYGDYLKVIFAILFVLLFIAIRLLTERVNIVLALFAIFPFAMDVVQLKSFYSEVFSFLGIAVLIRKMSKDDKNKVDLSLIIAIALGVLSMLFHFSAVYYILACVLFYLLHNMNKFNSKVFVISIIALGLICSGMLEFVLIIASKIGLISNIEYLSRYFQRGAHWGWLVPAVGVILIICACLIVKEPEGDMDPINKRQQLLRQFIVTISLLLPLLFVSITFDRLVRIYMIMMYIYFANRRKTLDVKVEKIFSYLCFVSSIVLFFVIDIYTVFDITWLSIMNYSEFVRELAG